MFSYRNGTISFVVQVDDAIAIVFAGNEICDAIRENERQFFQWIIVLRHDDRTSVSIEQSPQIALSVVVV